ncbi:MAG: JAB domain-containing protein [Candidatus Sedimenticola sp. (ex Thyasira tokunagai)]
MLERIELRNPKPIRRLSGFTVEEKAGKYKFTSRRPLTDDDIIAAARSILTRRISCAMPITCPNGAEQLLITQLAPEKEEVFSVLFLDTRHKALSLCTIARGTIDGAAVSIRQVVRRAIEENAAAVILAHNHPSGSLEPSGADQRITSNIKVALEMIDVRVLDHFIVGGGKSYSFARSGRLGMSNI